MLGRSPGGLAEQVAGARRLETELLAMQGAALALVEAAGEAGPQFGRAVASHVRPMRHLGSTSLAVLLGPLDHHVLRALRSSERAGQLSPDVTNAQAVCARMPELLAGIRPATAPMSWLLRRGSRRDRVEQALQAAEELVTWGQANAVVPRFQWAVSEITGAAQAADPIFDPIARPGHYRGIVEALGFPADTALAWRSIRPLVARRRVLSDAEHARAVEARLADEVRRAFGALRARMVTLALREIPVAKLRGTVREGGLRLAALERAGLRTVQDLLERAGSLTFIPGVGDQTAAQALGAARALAKAVEDDLAFRVDLDESDPQATQLLQRLTDWGQVAIPLRRLSAGIEAAEACLISFRGMPVIADGFIGLIGVEDGASETVDAEYRDWASWERTYEPELGALRRATNTAASGEDAWKAFRSHAADYYAWLGQVVGIDVSAEVQAGHLPAEIADAVRAQPLDTSLFIASLRGYQEFGAKYLLVQRRTILGDDMGLGKTVQAIAAMAHVAASGQHHSLVVCPASVLVNWTREISRHSRLRAFALHGADRHTNVVAWRRYGGVGVTTYGQLDTLDLRSSDRLGLLVADEAHYVKNSHTRRGRAVAAAIHRAERVALMTGTPLENRLEEFQALVRYVQPRLLDHIDATAAVAGARAFRDRIAPVYLRRNQSDVLSELPPVAHIDEWVELLPGDRRAHDGAVGRGNFMELRRSAFLGDGVDTAKARRLVELVCEARDNGRKTVVFSYFRDVVDAVVAHLRDHVTVIGPITGSVPPEQRQRMIDLLKQASEPVVLVSQIDAGGVGTNIQAASVVVLCEPQVKPSAEHQAVARVHRLGQVHHVQVYRLLGVDTVDQRMLEILAEKQRAFDAYVRESAVTSVAPEAVDISEPELARRVFAAEQRLLASRLSKGGGLRPVIPSTDDSVGR